MNISDELIDDYNDSFGDMPLRVILVTYLTALTFIQISLVSKHFEYASKLDNVYGMLSVLIALIIAVPVFRFGVKYRGELGGKLVMVAAVITALLPLGGVFL